MVSLQACTNLSSSTFSKFCLSSSNKFVVTSALNARKYLQNPRIIVQNFPSQVQKQHLIEELNKLTYLPSKETQQTTTKKDVTLRKLYTILEAINDRIEMHNNIGQQRENWNSLLLNSINMITLTAATMAGLAEASGPHGVGLKVSSTLLFLAGTGILLIMNKIQPSQLVEEQRNAVRLFKRVRGSMETTLATRTPSEKDVEEAMAKVLALDRAYPLPLLGAMIEKFPKTLEPAKWWPELNNKHYYSTSKDATKWSNNNVQNNNGWNEKLENDIEEIVGVTKSKDIEDYVRLGNKALKLNKMLAVSGPLLTGIAAVGAAFVGHGGPWAGVMAAAAGSMAAVVNTIEHGGQVGMVFEMYRNCAGFFKLLEETVESTLLESDLEKRENGEVFELKMALHLGRNLCELRDFAEKARKNGGSVDEFASKLF